MWNKVEKILKERNISIYRLAKMTNIPDTTLRSYRLKGSEPSFTKVCKIDDALNISLEDLRERND